jgi:signal peptidase
MTDPEDGADRDGPSDDPAEGDPFVYPGDEDAGADGAGDDDSPSDADRDAADRDAADRDAARDDEVTDTGPAAARDATRQGPPGDRSAREATPDEGPRGVGGWLRWFWSADSGAAVYVRDVLTSVTAVLLVGLVLFAISGIWPPMVAVESPSMEPNMNTGDLVFVVDNDRFVPDAAVSHDNRTTGVVPAERAAGTGHTEFARPGDVIIFMPDGNDRKTPVIHRAMLFVTEAENWYDRAVALDSGAVGNAESCDELNNCPAPHAGFVTKGDNNPKYDQQTTLSAPVKPQWIIGTAELKVPYLGYIRLAFAGQVAPPLETATAGAGGSPSEPTTAPTGDGTAASSPTASRTSAVTAVGHGRPVA